VYVVKQREHPHTHTHTHTHTRARAHTTSQHQRSERDDSSVLPGGVERAKIYRPLTDTEPCSKCCKTHRPCVRAHACMCVCVCMHKYICICEA
jgi:hypothetical protein